MGTRAIVCAVCFLVVPAFAEMWDQMLGHVDKKAHMKAMFELTTRMNSLARVVVGPANISATTALQVGHTRVLAAFSLEGQQDVTTHHKKLR